jgi:hypothetical protein
MCIRVGLGLYNIVNRGYIIITTNNIGSTIATPADSNAIYEKGIPR